MNHFKFLASTCYFHNITNHANYQSQWDTVLYSGEEYSLEMNLPYVGLFQYLNKDIFLDAVMRHLNLV